MNVCGIQGKYKNNYIIVKKYTDKLYKVTHIKGSIRVAGYENEEIYIPGKGTVNDEKLDCNIARARENVLDMSMCNPWDLFVTLTLNKNKYDRHDLKKFKSDLSHFLRNYNAKYDLHIKYLLIPEMHADGAWHMHGFLYGLPETHLFKNKNGYSDWSAYSEKFGYISIDKIRSEMGASFYILKYIKKDLSARSKELNAHLYYCSQGLKRAEIIKEGTPTAIGIPSTWENEYCSILWIKDGSIEKLDTIVTWDWIKSNT